jgi:hypothetical protein
LGLCARRRADKIDLVAGKSLPMKFLMLIYGNEEVWNSLPPTDIEALIGRVEAFNEALRESGELIGVEGLIPQPRSVRMVRDAVIVTDGPYLEAKEFVGSYFMVDVDDEQRALEIARSYPGMEFGGGLEVWPLMERGGGRM